MKEAKMIKTDKNSKIGFILSARTDYDKSNNKFYRYLWKTYKAMSISDINIEFNYHLTH